MATFIAMQILKAKTTSTETLSNLAVQSYKSTK